MNTRYSSRASSNEDYPITTRSQSGKKVTVKKAQTIAAKTQQQSTEKKVLLQNIGITMPYVHNEVKIQEIQDLDS